MIVTSADVVPGQNVQVLGLVRGNIVTSRHIGRDMMAGMKELVGGEIKSYTEMTDQARTVAEGRMIAEAERLGADAWLPCASRAAPSTPAPSRCSHTAPP